MMKPMIKKVVVLFLLFAAVSFGQDVLAQKVGHINVDSLVKMMPQYDTAEKKLQKYAAELQKSIDKAKKEYELLIKEYQEIPQSAQSTKKLKENEIIELENKIQTRTAAAQEDLVSMQQELLKPIIDKVKKTIEEVAKEKGYTLVIDSSTGILIYSLPADDLMNEVKRKLGIK